MPTKGKKGRRNVRESRQLQEVSDKHKYKGWKETQNQGPTEQAA